MTQTLYIALSMTEVTTLLTEGLAPAAHRKCWRERLEARGAGGLLVWFGLNNFWMRSSNTDHLMFKKLLITNFE